MQGVLDFARAGMAWGLRPVALAGPHLASNHLVELPPALPVEVTLYWTVARLQATSLHALTDAVRSVARACVHA